MAERPEVYGGFAIGPDGNEQSLQVSFNGDDTYIANNNGQNEDQFWREHNHYRAGGWDGGGGQRGHYTGPGA